MLGRSLLPTEAKSTLLERQLLIAAWAVKRLAKYTSDVQREASGGKFPGISRFLGNGREIFGPREFPSFGNFPGNFPGISRFSGISWENFPGNSQI